jgi:pimeloyl-ACP methyl ester carboxylesterase
MKFAFTTTVLALLGFAAIAQTTAKKNETIVLVHGAWADASAWHGVTPLLQAKGYEVVEVNLPGHGKDETSFGAITLQSYVDAVTKAIGTKKNVILVGHSMGGLVISQTAEAIPGQIKELVFLSAFLPRNGESLLSLAKQDADSHIGKYLTIDEKNGTAVIAKEGIAEVFALDAPAEVQQYLVANTKPEPLGPLVTPVSLTESNFGKVKKVYIYTTLDNAVSFNAQKAMVKNTAVSKEYTIASSHTPFISSAAILAEDILQSIR